MVQIAIVFALILLNAFFSLAEYALITVRGSRIRQLVEEGNKTAEYVEQLKEHPTRLQATLQTGLTLVTTFSSAIAASRLVEPVTQWLVRLIAHGTFGLPSVHSFPDFANSVALILVTVPVAILTLVIGEIAPKSFAMHHPEKVALLAVHPIRWLETLLSPVVVVLTFLSNIIVRPFGGAATFAPRVVDADEYKIIVDAGKESGVLDSVETSMIHQVLDFGDTVVRKVMTPRIDLTAASIDASIAELISLISESGHSRIPIFDGDLDNLVGIVHAKDLLAFQTKSDLVRVKIRDVMRTPLVIPETKRVGELLAELRKGKQQFAIVRDEYGVTSGIITIEDLLEQIVGEIQDEYDTEEPMVQVIDAQTTILDGLMGVAEVNDRMGLELPEDEADTIGGFVFSLLGHQALAGESVGYENSQFIVEATDGRRITKVRLKRSPADTLRDEVRTSSDSVENEDSEYSSQRSGNGN